MTTTVADLLITALADHGVTQVWGVVGDALNPVTDAIRREDRIEWVGVRHEEAGAFAAERPGPAHRPARRLHGHRRAGRDPPAQRPVRREEEPHPGAGDHRPGAARGHGQRLLPGGRQRRAVRRRVGVLPDGHQRRPVPVADRAGGQRRAPGAGRRGADAARRRRRPRPAEAHRCPAVRRRGPGTRALRRVAARRRRRHQRRRPGDPAGRTGRAPRPRGGAGPRRAARRPRWW